jgi:hypothetical protein
MMVLQDGDVLLVCGAVGPRLQHCRAIGNVKRRRHPRFPAPSVPKDLGTSCHWPAVARVVVADGAKQPIPLEERGARRGRYPKTRAEEGSRWNRHRSMARGECYRDGTAMMKKCCGRFS